MALTGNFDLYYLIVELITGNIFTAMLLISLIILIIGIITRISVITISYIEIIFAAMYMTLWFGGIWAALIFMVSGGYFGWELFRFLKESQS